MAEISVGVRELKMHLSEYLRQIKQGKTIVITEHGRAVGRLLPASLPLADRMAALQQAGIVRWNGKKLPSVKRKAEWRGPVSVAQLISEDRE